MNEKTDEKCHECGSTSIDVDPYRDPYLVCIECGLVLESEAFIRELQHEAVQLETYDYE